MEEEDINIKKAWVESRVIEFGRILHGAVLLINEEEVENVQVIFEAMLNDAWESARKPLLEALIKKFQ